MAKRKTGLLGRLLAAIIIIILLVAIVGAIFEIFIAPAPSKVESQLKSKDNISVTATTGTAAALLAKGDLYLLYGYANSSLTDKVTNDVVISYKETKDGEETTYTAMVIYFETMSDANTVRKGIKDKVKEQDKVTMFRGKTLVVGDKQAVMRYYYVLF
ncbi:MAG: hypothetical protein E7338_06920 [Clostridiales bacterium]|nr:hypothetical protein [Clostridiales bacterium]